MSNNIDYKAAYERQKRARAQAEDILEVKSRELYEKNQALLDAYHTLKHQKTQLLHQEKLASIGQLAAGVAHEINNPTGFVKSNLHSLFNYFNNMVQLIDFFDQHVNTFQKDGLLPEKFQLDLELAKQTSDWEYIQQDFNDLFTESLTGLARIEDIVKSLKSFARPDSAEQSLYNINDCIQNTVKLVWSELKYKAELRYELEPVPDSYGYPGEISQIILNLLVNAAQAIVDSGTITIATYHMDDTIVFQVSDVGAGIKEEDLYRIFDPFFTTKDIDTGTGLGLSITHGIVKKHGGDIEVNSLEGHGTTFTIALPILDKPIKPVTQQDEDC